MFKIVLLIVIFIMILYLLCDLLCKSYEHYAPFGPTHEGPYPYTYSYYYPYVSPYPNLRHTKNMSYDIRGDVPISHIMNMPFNMSPLI
jgi:hypothetical protein